MEWMDHDIKFFRCLLTIVMEWIDLDTKSTMFPEYCDGMGCTINIEYVAPSAL